MPSSAIHNEQTRVGRRLILAGMVQGLGLRPAIARFAIECSVTGRVCNRLYGVEVIVEGTASDVYRFEAELSKNLPRESLRNAMKATDIAATGFKEFRIDEDHSSGKVESEIPQDRAICPDCLRDVERSASRRHGYAWTSCTSCGPRYSILIALPYERRQTTMSGFAFCAECRREYESSVDRRFHSQTNSCSICGPNVWLVKERRQVSSSTEAISQAARALQGGAILALRGIGGYQLLCDATSLAVVEKLRKRKRRSAKPFAVLVKDVTVAKEFAELTVRESELLTSPENPIVLVTARGQTRIAANVAPGLESFGLMLPASGLHWMLCEQAGRPLVATSGNGEGAPLATAVEQAEQGLEEIADVFLHHDREIANAVDDSVVQCVGERPMLLRCGRGYAPLPLKLPATSRTILATGGEQKSALAFSNGKQSFLGQYVGDLEGLAVRDRFLSVGRSLQSLCGAEADVLVHDLHPDYFSTRWAMSEGLPCRAVQHHHAHVVAGMLEAGWLDGTVLGIAFDGTGYGTDGSVWGGEFLIATSSEFQRVACLRPFRLPGGAPAIREPWRIWTSLVAQLKDDLPKHYLGGSFGRSRSDLEIIARLAESANLSIQTTSAGRLFDGVPAFLLGHDRAEYDGQLPMLLEAITDASAPGSYPMGLKRGRPALLDWRPLIRELILDESSPLGSRAMRFHRGIAEGIIQVANLFPSLPVVLTGGVFQNRILAGLVYDMLTEARREVWLPALIPPNDGGLATGQLAIAIALEIAAGSKKSGLHTVSVDSERD